nr:uncharacterized protein LOC113393520 [Vanessa tameamea]
MEKIVVKTEVQPNGDILLFYVDENEETDLRGLENEVQNNVQLLPDTKYIIEEDLGEGESAEELDIAQATEQVSNDIWLEDEIKRLIVFYLDNKETFLSGATKKTHLWAVACKTMLAGKTPILCEVKLRELKKNYVQVCLENQNGGTIIWNYYNLCNQAFHDDNFVKMCLSENSSDNQITVNMPVKNVVNQDGILVVKKVNSCQNKDEQVEAMLNSYIKHKTFFQKQYNTQRGLWEAIAMDLGEEDVDYWHKRFLNFKQHYIRMIYKRKESGAESINWPYMKYFDQIFGDDEDFSRKYLYSEENDTKVSIMIENDPNSWNDIEITFLVKYYFDCFNEFHDPSIPNNFLWQEVGRLIDKTPENCEKKFEDLKNEHFGKLIEGDYDLANRIPLAILFDNIIAKEVEMEVNNPEKDGPDLWKTEQIDELVQYLYENIDMLKDPVCYYVSWASLARKLKRSVTSCRKQWNDLTTLYKNILDDKKENPDMQIDWRYIDLFDRIFDYGMDSNLLDGYEKLKELGQVNKSNKVGVKKITIKDNDDKFLENGTDDEELYDERGFTKRSKKRNGDAKAFKILEFYLKNKDKFASSQQKKLALWEILARQIGITATECAHRFRNFKQVYTGYVQREINKPEMPILWPYYNLCKKVFGYRAIKSKLKNGKMDSDDAEDWSAKEIKQLINYFSRNFSNFQENIEARSKWTEIAQEISRTETSCCDKFLELRKSYRKLKTMKARNPDVKVSWKYFNMLDDIYKYGEQNCEVLENMEVDECNDDDNEIKLEMQEDDDYQCIIVIPEGEDINNTQIIIQEQEQDQDKDQEATEITNSKQIITKWNKRSKKRLLTLYLNYLRVHKGQEINQREMWTEIASKLDEKTPISCKKMFLKLKNQHKQLNEADFKLPYSVLLEKILTFKPKFAKSNKNKDLEEINTYEDIPMSNEKVYNALNYYLQNLEDFVSPKFEQKYLWTELAKFISEPVNKIFSKINYLKQTFDSEIDTPFKEILHEILTKENALREEINKDPDPITEEDSEQTWSDIETERLLTWYLAHLDKFKNPKFVRSYLWMEASDILKKSPLVCSKKMSEIRSQYRTMVRENPEELDNWKFYNLCQRIYGTGKKSSTSNKGLEDI